MSEKTNQLEVGEIRKLINRQFESLNWKNGEAPDWKTFRDDFHPQAKLFPSARPTKPQDVDEFVWRMSDLAKTGLQSFEETVLGSSIQVFGNVAVAMVGCENIENGKETNRTVEAMLLIKENGSWLVAGQAWDKVAPEQDLPKALRTQA